MNGLLVLVGALGGGLLGVIATELFRKKKTGAETDELSAKASDIITKMAVELAEKTTELSDKREARLEAKVSSLETRVDHLRVVIDLLSDQLEAAGLTPEIPPQPNYRPTT